MRTILLLLVSSIFLAPTAKAQQPGKPNILFLLADDQCFEALGAAGNPEVRTPNLDELAHRGTMFTNAYNMGSWTGAVCVASRTMLNTGRSVWRARAADLPALAEQQQFWSQRMQRAGYRTYMSGKWHIGGVQPQQVFDHAVHVRPGMPNQTDEGYLRPTADGEDVWSPYNPQFGGYWKGGKHWSEVLADDSTELIAQAAKDDKPFFMYLAFNAPHDPRQSPQRFVEMYDRREISVPESFLPEYPFKQEIGCYRVGSQPGAAGLQRDEKLAPWPRTEPAVQLHRQEYYALITHMDEQIGRILAALDASGQRDETIIVFTADHGLACGRHGLLGKQNMYEHSMKPPLIVVGPGMPQGERRDVRVYMQDVMPTTLELAGAEAPHDLEFHSLMPHIRDGDLPSDYDAIYGCYETGLQRMVRQGDWKLIVYPQASVVRLFNLADDSHEMHDLAKDPRQEDRIARLFQQLLASQQEMGDQLDLKAAFPQLASTP